MAWLGFARAASGELGPFCVAGELGQRSVLLFGESRPTFLGEKNFSVIWREIAPIFACFERVFHFLQLRRLLGQLIVLRNRWWMLRRVSGCFGRESRSRSTVRLSRALPEAELTHKAEMRALVAAVFGCASRYDH